jgi:LIM domain
MSRSARVGEEEKKINDKMSAFDSTPEEKELQRLSKRGIVSSEDVRHTGGKVVVVDSDANKHKLPNFCVECGTARKGMGKFCTNCGKLLSPDLSTTLPVADAKPGAPKPTKAAERAKSEREKTLESWNTSPAPHEVKREPVPAGCCAGCRKEHHGNALVALKLEWHDACFNCFRCSTNLNGKKFRRNSPLDPRPICSKCYDLANSELCARCFEPITNAFVEIGGQPIHPQCQ